MIRAGSGNVRAALELLSGEDFVRFLALSIREGNERLMQSIAWPSDPSEWLARFLAERMVRLGLAAARLEASGAPS